MEYSPLYSTSLADAIALHSGFSVAPPCGAYTLLRSQLLGPGCRGPGRLRGCQWLDCVALEQELFPSPSHEPDIHLPFMGDLLVPLSRLPAALLSQLMMTLLSQGLGRNPDLVMWFWGMGNSLPPFPKPSWHLLFTGDPLVPPSQILMTPLADLGLPEYPYLISFGLAQTYGRG